MKPDPIASSLILAGVDAMMICIPLYPIIISYRAYDEKWERKNWGGARSIRRCSSKSGDGRKEGWGLSSRDGDDASVL